jgi:glycosyltransferase involved in cell wall biosynthesis
MKSTISQVLELEEEKSEKHALNPLVSIVVPAFNEAGIIVKNLEILCRYMRSLEDQYRWELIVVNDGSSDKTGDLADQFADGCDNVKILHHMYNFRLGQAMRHAFNNCRGDYVVTMDLDLSYSTDHIGKMLERIKETRAKIVVASPYMKGGKVTNVPWIRKMLSVWANRFMSLTVTRDLFSDRLSTLTCMVRAYDGKFLSGLNLKAMDVDIHPEIIYKAMILRARIVEIPAHLKWEKEDGVKRISSMRIFRGILSALFSGFIFRPFMFFILPGLALNLLSFYSFFFVFSHIYNCFHALPLSLGAFNYRLGASVAVAFGKAPHTFVIAGISLVVAIQLISLGILSLQNKKYFEEIFHLGTSVYKREHERERCSP